MIVGGQSHSANCHRARIGSERKAGRHFCSAATGGVSRKRAGRFGDEIGEAQSKMNKKRVEKKICMSVKRESRFHFFGLNQGFGMMVPHSDHPIGPFSLDVFHNEFSDEGNNTVFHLA